MLLEERAGKKRGRRKDRKKKKERERERERERGEKETRRENIYGPRHGLIMLALEIRKLFADKLLRAC